MAIIESRLKDGLLTLGATPGEIDFSCQVTNARINSSYDDDGDALETLCGDTIPAGRKLSGRALAGTFVQDWTAATPADSITLFCFLHDLETLAFTFTPNATAGPTLSGNLRVEVPGETFGGDVNTRVTSDFEWAISGELIFDPPLVVGAAAAAEAPAAGETVPAEPEPEPSPV